SQEQVGAGEADHRVGAGAQPAVAPAAPQARPQAAGGSSHGLDPETIPRGPASPPRRIDRAGAPSDILLLIFLIAVLQYFAVARRGHSPLQGGSPTMQGRFTDTWEAALTAETAARERKAQERSYRRMLAMTDALLGRLEVLNLRGQDRLSR